MKKTKIHLISIALVMCFLICLESAASGITNSNHVIYSTGQIIYENLGSTNKAITAYGLSFSDSDISFVANHFDLLNTDFDGTRSDFYIPFLPAMQKIKTINSLIKIIGYKDMIGIYQYNNDWTVVNSHEDWFIHDTNGNRIKNTQWGWYLMDVGSAGWREHFTSYINDKMNNAVYDGVFADDVRTQISSDEFDRQIPNSVISRWHSDTTSMLQYVKANMLSGKMFIINTDNWSSLDYINEADGMMIEGFGHASWESIDSPGTRTINTILNQINALSTNSANGKLVWAATGSLIQNPINTEKVNTMTKYCYSIFLLGTNGDQAYWGWNDWYSSDESQGYQTISETQIGLPTGAYYLNQNVYMRNFTQGKVVVNLSAYSRTVNFGEYYKLLNGTVISSEILNPYSGEILLKI